MCLTLSRQAYPVLARNEPPVSGGVRWSRSLFRRCQHTYAKLMAEEPAALQLPAGAQVRPRSIPGCSARSSCMHASYCMRSDKLQVPLCASAGRCAALFTHDALERCMLCMNVHGT